MQGLSEVGTAALERVRDGLRSGALRPPVTEAALHAFGIRHAEALADTLGGHAHHACLALLEVVIMERRANERPGPELVWTGPEATSATARDTAVVLRQLFESARERVILAGYSFSHAHHVLEPLYRAMRDRGVEATFVVHIAQAERRTSPPERHAATELASFVRQSWPFGAPYPRIFYDARALIPGPPYCSMHAKCVVIDDARAFLSSANFTERGQERNIEAGVLLHDPHFAEHLARQWLGLIESKHALEWTPGG
jgi:phosphatidylserine/phosphatidylglycerophosphate/cardiolipin synthase-like enzyme